MTSIETSIVEWPYGWNSQLINQAPRLSLMKRQTLEISFAIALAALCFELYSIRTPNDHHTSEISLQADRGKSNMSLRGADFPRTFIKEISIDLASPNHSVRLTWSGPRARQREIGPFHSSPGRGRGTNNCDDTTESNRGGSNCTPKGRWKVEGFSDVMPTVAECKYVTWFVTAREIAIHSHSNVPDFPASHGCVRLEEHAAQLIHNNSIANATEVVVGGTWTQSK